MEKVEIRSHRHAPVEVPAFLCKNGFDLFGLPERPDGTVEGPTVVIRLFVHPGPSRYHRRRGPGSEFRDTTDGVSVELGKGPRI